MIKAIGVDIENIARFKESINNKKFLELIFTDREINYCNRKKEPEKSFAARFCAKEAVIKAHSKKLIMKDIEILATDSGKLNVFIFNKLKKEINCSISHTDDYAIAFVVIGG